MTLKVFSNINVFFDSVIMKIDGLSIQDEQSCLKISPFLNGILQNLRFALFSGRRGVEGSLFSIRLVHRFERPVVCLYPWRRYKLGRHLRSLILPPLCTSMQGNYYCKNKVIHQDI